jgi:hypothetical protein
MAAAAEYRTSDSACGDPGDSEATKGVTATLDWISNSCLFLFFDRSARVTSNLKEEVICSELRVGNRKPARLEENRLWELFSVEQIPQHHSMMGSS